MPPQSDAVDAIGLIFRGNLSDRGKDIIVVSPLRVTGRQNSDLAHELAHIVLNHELSEVREINGRPFRTCKPDEEEEATAFGATLLLLPRPLLVSAGRRDASIEQIAILLDNVTTAPIRRFESCMALVIVGHALSALGHIRQVQTQPRAIARG